VARFSYNLGKRFAPGVRKAKWFWYSAMGTKAQMIKTERAVGNDLAVQIRKKMPECTDKKIQELVGRIGSNLARYVADKNRSFNFEIINAKEPNAFALPGGFIFLTDSIIRLCSSDEDELAFVISHEMSHVIKSHAIERIITNSAVSAASRITPTKNIAGVYLKQFGTKLLTSAYSQDREIEADNLGVRLAAAAGFNPQGAIHLLQRLDQNEKNKNALSISSYFTSHPQTNERINNIKKQIEKIKN
jgi:predicted Zn-dependent protease